MKLLLILLLAGPAFASAPSTPPPESEPVSKNRSLRIGISSSYLFRAPDATTSPMLIGPALVYEFVLNERFALGILATFRNGFGTSAFRQLGYGLLMKHTFCDPDAGLRPYLEYGLLMNMNWMGGRAGTSTAHDTRLAAGLDFPLFQDRGFVDLGYHYNRIRLFEAPEVSMDRLELVFGYRVRW